MIGIISIELMGIIATGIFAGFLAAFFGIGGGVIFVPMLILIFGLEPANAVATSLLAIIFTSLSSVIAYRKSNLVQFKSGVAYSLITIPGALVGAYLTNVLPGSLLRIMFSILLFFTAYNFLKKKKVNTENSNFKESQKIDGKKLSAYPVFFLAGVASGLLGIGGGIIYVPIMTLLLDYEIHEAIATSCLIILITAIFGTIGHFLLGHVYIYLSILFGIMGVMGAQMGARISQKAKSKTLRSLFAVFLAFTSIRLILT